MEKISLRRKCPICKCCEGEEIYHLKMMLPREYQLPESYNIVSCKECGFCFADTYATEQDYAFYYENSNYYSQKPQTSDYENILNKWIALFASVSKDKIILDMGFGNGELLVKLKNNGFVNLCGIDTSREGVELLRKQNIDARFGSIYDSVPTDLENKVDIMIMSGVFEHLLEPADALLKARAYLNDNGMLICLVPNMDNLAKTSLSLSYFFHHEHINYFTYHSLINFMQLGGFKEKKIYDRFDEYENLVSIFKKVETVGGYTYDDSGKAVLNQYFKKQDEVDKKMKERIDELVKEQVPIIIWGIGAFFMRAWENSDLKRTNIVAFVDKNPIKVRDLKLGTWKVISPDMLAEKKMKGTIVVFCAKDSNSIIRDISVMGIDNNIIVM